MKGFKSVIWAFVIGGLLAVVAQVLLILYSGFIPDFAGPAALITMGLLGALLTALGKYQKLEQLGLMGTTVLFSGLGAVVAKVYSEVVASGAPSSVAVKKALLAFLQVVGVGSIGAAVIGVIAYLA